MPKIEIIFRRPDVVCPLDCCVSLHRIEQLESVKLLGIYLQNDLSFRAMLAKFLISLAIYTS